jgi:hypothetical protein
LIIVLVLAALGCIGIGFAIGRWGVIVPASAVWPLYLLGLKEGWWGSGVGEGWQYSLAFGVLLVAIATGTGVLARRTNRRLA